MPRIVYEEMKRKFFKPVLFSSSTRNVLRKFINTLWLLVLICISCSSSRQSARLGFPTTDFLASDTPSDSRLRHVPRLLGVGLACNLTSPLGGLPGLQVQDHQLITLPHRRSVLSYKIQTLFLEDALLRSDLSTGVTMIISFS